MLTDSGGFQVFSLAKLRKITAEGVEFRSHLDGSKHFFSPEHSMAVQIALGADVMMVFDECVETPASWERTRDSMALTHAWAERSKAYWMEHRGEVPWTTQVIRMRDLGHPDCVARFEGKHQALFGIVQGGMYADLRRESAQTAGGDGLAGVCDWRAGGGGASRGDARDDCADAGVSAEG